MEITTQDLFQEQIRNTRSVILEKYYKAHACAESHIDSFNRSVEHEIPKIVEGLCTLKTKIFDKKSQTWFYIIWRVLKEDVLLVRPQETPLSCQKKNNTYHGEIVAGITRFIFTKPESAGNVTDLFHKDKHKEKLTTAKLALAHKSSSSSSGQQRQHQASCPSSRQQQKQPQSDLDMGTPARQEADVGSEEDVEAPEEGNDDRDDLSDSESCEEAPPEIVVSFSKSLRSTVDQHARLDVEKCFRTFKQRDKAFSKCVGYDRSLRVPITQWPCMVNSKMCVLSGRQGYFPEHPDTMTLKVFEGYERLEHGGHFVVNGKRRFIPFIKSIACNKILTFRVASKNRTVVQVRSQSQKAQFRSTQTLEIYVDKDQKLSRKKTVAHAPLMKIPFFSKPVPFSVVCLAMGHTCEAFWDNVRRMVPRPLWSDRLFSKYLDGLTHSTMGVATQEQAIECLGRLYGRYTGDNAGYSAIFCEILPNLNPSSKGFDRYTPSDYAERQAALNRTKTQFLALCMAHLLVVAEGIVEPQKKTSREVVRYVHSGRSMSVLLRLQLYHIMKQSIRIARRFLKDGQDIETEKLYPHARLSESIMQALATGTFTMLKKGVSQPMNTTNQTVIESQLRRTITTNCSEGSHVSTRMVDASSCGYECAAETPEGKSCGLVGQLACTATLTMGFEQEQVRWNARAHLQAVAASSSTFLPEFFETSVFPDKRRATTEKTDGPSSSFSSSSNSDCGCEQHPRADACMCEKKRPNTCLCIELFRRQSAAAKAESMFSYLAGNEETKQRIQSTVAHHNASCVCLRPTVSVEADRQDPWKILGPSGGVFGWTSFPWLVREVLTDARRQGVFPDTVTVSMNERLCSIQLECDAGRLCRPLLRAEWFRSPPLLQVVSQDLILSQALGCSPNQVLRHLFALGVIEYITPGEEANLRPTFSYRQVAAEATHLELTDIAIGGFTASKVPFANFCQGPRLAYSAGKLKQAISSETVDRGSNRAYRSTVGHTPLTYTAASMHMGDDSKQYTNVVMAVFPGKNAQEDAVMINRQFLDNSGMALIRTRVYSAEVSAETSRRGKSSKTSRAARFRRPEPTNTRLRLDADYSNIRPNGLPRKGDYVKENSAVIGRTCPLKYLPQGARVSAPPQCFVAKEGDSSVLSNRHETGTVTSADIYTDHTGKQTAKVMVTSFYPHADQGDKLSSRHAQKGTIGRIVDPEDMPFDANTGATPDMIFSPIGLTSRMTMGTLLEILTGTAVTGTGDLLYGIDEQDFEGDMQLRIEAMQDVLVRCGMRRDGKAWMIDGKTGKMIRVPIYRGIVSIARLVQLVQNKIHARGPVGPIDQQSRQPTEGKANDGGHRFGEMEVNALTAHGARRILQERMVDASDGFTIYVCCACNNMAIGNPKVDHYHCDVCNHGDDVVPVQISWSTKCVVQELMSQGIKVQFDVEKVYT